LYAEPGCPDERREASQTVLLTAAESNPEGQARNAVFRQSLQKRGSIIEGLNIRIDVRWPGR
jgi:hypothetical protein